MRDWQGVRVDVLASSRGGFNPGVGGAAEDGAVAVVGAGRIDHSQATCVEERPQISRTRLQFVRAVSPLPAMRRRLDVQSGRRAFIVTKWILRIGDVPPADGC